MAEDLDELSGGNARRRVEPELFLGPDPVTFWSNLEPPSDDTSMRNSEPM
jgi:hypothetical protein